MSVQRVINCVLILAIAASAVALAACGGDDSGGGQKLTAPGEKFTGKPVVIASTGVLDSSLGSFPQLFAGERAAARALNAKGGINGHEVRIETCNGKSDPNLEVACARQAVNSQAIATVGNLVISNDNGVLDTLTKGGVPSIGATSPQVPNWQRDIAFPIDFGPGQWSECVSKPVLEASKATGPGRLLGQEPISKGNDLLLIQSAQAAGVKSPGFIKVPSSTTDFAPLIPRIADLKTNLLVVNVSPPQVGSFISAVKASGKKYTYCQLEGLSAGSTIEALGDASTQLFEGSTLPPLSQANKIPALKQFEADMKAQQKAGDGAASLSFSNYNSASLRAWAAVNVVAQVAKKLHDPTDRKAFLAALRSSKSVDTGIYKKPLDFSSPLKGGGIYTRVFNDTTRLVKYDPARKAKIQIGPEHSGLEGLGVLQP